MMANGLVLEPDLDFIKDVKARGAEDLKKCFQCATCAVTCPISPDTKPFPRKEMIAASWGLKDRLVANHDIWLCHNCGDCSTMCPRGASPGDMLAAVRSYAIGEYATPKKLAKMVNDPTKLPILAAIPAVLFIVLGFITGLMDFTPPTDMIASSSFISTWLVDMIFVPTSIFVVVVFALGLKRFLADIHQNALLTGKTNKKEIDAGGFIQGLVRVIPTILKHDRFSECGENKNRSTSHLLVLFSFIALFIVTSIVFMLLYGLGIHGPFSQLNPIKWLANIGGVALIIGVCLMINDRLKKKDEKSSYADWYLLGLILVVGLTGMFAQIFRLAGAAAPTYIIYFLHLISVWLLIAFLPFSKLAHLVYRTVAMAYHEYSERK